MAEVLITLAIIGVVAAMTIPTLVANYNKKTIETRLLRSYSAINQAIKLSTVYNGDTQTWDSDISKASSIWTYDELETWFNKYLAPHIKYLKIDKHTFSYENSNGDTTNDERLLVYLSDGSILLLQSINPYDCGIIVSGNVNNAVDGKDLFAFKFESNNGANLSFVPYAPELYFDGSIESAKNAQRYGCYKETRMLCTKLIQLNGWKIPDDYPYIK
ncbi:type II secretion system protein [bacterium]|nr:type II secretion system protein [bacterium]